MEPITLEGSILVHQASEWPQDILAFFPEETRGGKLLELMVRLEEREERQEMHHSFSGDGIVEIFLKWGSVILRNMTNQWTTNSKVWEGIGRVNLRSIGMTTQSGNYSTGYTAWNYYYYLHCGGQELPELIVGDAKVTIYPI